MSAASGGSDAAVRPGRRRRRRLYRRGALRRRVRRRGAVVDEGDAEGVVVPGVGVGREFQIVVSAAAAVPAPSAAVCRLLGVQDVLRVVHGHHSVAAITADVWHAAVVRRFVWNLGRRGKSVNARSQID